MQPTSSRSVAFNNTHKSSPTASWYEKVPLICTLQNLFRGSRHSTFYFFQILNLGILLLSQTVISLLCKKNNNNNEKFKHSHCVTSQSLFYYLLLILLQPIVIKKLNQQLTSESKRTSDTFCIDCHFIRKRLQI